MTTSPSPPYTSPQLDPSRASAFTLSRLIATVRWFVDWVGTAVFGPALPRAEGRWEPSGSRTFAGAAGAFEPLPVAWDAPPPPFAAGPRAGTLAARSDVAPFPALVSVVWEPPASFEAGDTLALVVRWGPEGGTPQEAPCAPFPVEHGQTLTAVAALEPGWTLEVGIVPVDRAATGLTGTGWAARASVVALLGGTGATASAAPDARLTFEAVSVGGVALGARLPADLSGLAARWTLSMEAVEADEFTRAVDVRLEAGGASLTPTLERDLAPARDGPYSLAFTLSAADVAALGAPEDVEVVVAYASLNGRRHEARRRFPVGGGGAVWGTLLADGQTPSALAAEDALGEDVDGVVITAPPAADGTRLWLLSERRVVSLVNLAIGVDELASFEDAGPLTLGGEGGGASFHALRSPVLRAGAALRFRVRFAA